MKPEFFRFLLAVAISAWLATPSCEKRFPDPPPPAIPYWDTLPAITQEGKNTYGCLINGKVWVPHVPVMAWYSLYDKIANLDEKKQLGYGQITCNLVTNIQHEPDTLDDMIQIEFMPTFFNPTTFHTSPDTTDTLRFFPAIRRGVKCYYPDDIHSGSTNNLIINKIDTTLSFFCGTFSFTLYNAKDKNDSIVVTDGRFDLRYYTQ